MNVQITMDDGRKVPLEEVWCEVTGDQLCWATIPPDKPGCTPAYISFKVIDHDGKQLVSPLNVETF